MFASDDRQVKSKLSRGDGHGFSPVPSQTSGLYQDLGESLRIDSDLMARYADYEEMDDYGELGSALDVYADDATIPDNDHGRSIWAVSKDVIVRDVLNYQFEKVWKIEEDIWPLTRTVAKYGNGYAELLISKNGVVGFTFLPPPSVRRVEEEDGALIGFVQDPNARFNISGS